MRLVTFLMIITLVISCTNQIKIKRSQVIETLRSFIPGTVIEMTEDLSHHIEEKVGKGLTLSINNFFTEAAKRYFSIEDIMMYSSKSDLNDQGFVEFNHPGDLLALKREGNELHYVGRKVGQFRNDFLEHFCDTKELACEITLDPENGRYDIKFDKDITAPMLLGLDLGKDQFQTGDDVPLLVHTTDDYSGVAQVTAKFVNNEGAVIEFARKDIRSKMVLLIQKLTPGLTGQFYLTEMTLTDHAGFQRNYTAMEQLIDGTNLQRPSFAVAESSPLAAPEDASSSEAIIKSIRLRESELSLGQTQRVEIEFAENQSDMTFWEAHFKNDAGDFLTYYGFQSETLSSHGEPQEIWYGTRGLFKLSYISIRYKDKNARYLAVSEGRIEGHDLDLPKFHVTAPAEQNPPKVESLSVSTKPPHPADSSSMVDILGQIVVNDEATPALEVTLFFKRTEKSELYQEEFRIVVNPQSPRLRLEEDYVISLPTDIYSGSYLLNKISIVDFSMETYLIGVSQGLIEGTAIPAPQVSIGENRGE